MSLLLLGLALGATPVVPLPSGTYKYAMHADGKVTATSTVIIEHTAQAITVKETLEAQGKTNGTLRKLDPATFSTLSWRGLIQDAGSDTVTLSARGATYRHDGSTKTLAPPAAGAPSAVYDFFVAEYATLPAMLHATGAKRYNEYCVCIGEFTVKAISVVASSANRPAGVRPGDVAIALTDGNATATLWYDPNSFVLSEFDLPSEKISFVRL